MSIQLPEELSQVATAAGVHWPAADEDAMRQQATAWREAGNKVTVLTGDADHVAKGSLSTVDGEPHRLASAHWSGFVDPDSGHLTATANGCYSAADRLDHAANQVGAAKVAIVKHLVGLAKRSDAAHAAATGGHPTALLGLPAETSRTGAHIARINHTLTKAVQPDSGVTIDGSAGPVSTRVHASPQAHIASHGGGLGVSAHTPVGD
ncbi:MAG: hypothetical protein J2O49_04360, partial [Sciscionella sp.]|nr:hypothetical protein [Sciscionella sp.]